MRERQRGRVFLCEREDVGMCVSRVAGAGVYELKTHSSDRFVEYKKDSFQFVT